MRLCRRELREVKVLADASDTAPANLTRAAVAYENLLFAHADHSAHRGTPFSQHFYRSGDRSCGLVDMAVWGERLRGVRRKCRKGSEIEGCISDTSFFLRVLNSKDDVSQPAVICSMTGDKTATSTSRVLIRHQAKLNTLTASTRPMSQRKLSAKENCRRNCRTKVLKPSDKPRLLKLLEQNWRSGSKLLERKR